MRDAEKRYVSTILQKIQITRYSKELSICAPGMMSPKLESLIEILLEEYDNENDPSEFSGLIFVEQRIAVAILAEALAAHPKTRDRFSSTLLCGTSSFVTRTKASAISELIFAKNKKFTLDDFSNGTTNLLISTSVGEEGIDIQACAVVICFRLPANMKSFIQIRGRARRKGSRCILMFPKDHSQQDQKLNSWKDMEIEMKRVYEDDLRHILEEANADEEEEDEDCEGKISPFRTTKY